MYQWLGFWLCDDDDDDPGLWQRQPGRLACHTQEEIAEREGITHQQVANIIEESANYGKLAENCKALANHAAYLGVRLGQPLSLLISPTEGRESLSPLMIKVEVYDCDSGESRGEARRK